MALREKIEYLKNQIKDNNSSEIKIDSIRLKKQLQETKLQYLQALY